MNSCVCSERKREKRRANSGLPEDVLRQRVEKLLGLAHACALVDLVQDGPEAEEHLAEARVVGVFCPRSPSKGVLGAAHRHRSQRGGDRAQTGLGGLEDVADEERVEREPLGRLDDEPGDVEALGARILEHALERQEQAQWWCEGNEHSASRDQRERERERETLQTL